MPPDTSPRSAAESFEEDLGGNILDRDRSLIGQLLDECPVFIRELETEDARRHVRVEVDDGRDAGLGDLVAVRKLGERDAITA